MMNQFKEDWEKALLFLYAQEGISSKEKQIEILAFLCGWEIDRSKQAFLEAEKRGMSTAKPIELGLN